jgi:hypothetical protein
MLLQQCSVNLVQLLGMQQPQYAGKARTQQQQRLGIV